MKRRVIVLVILLHSIVCSLAFALESSQLFEQGMEAFRMGNYGSSELIFRKIIDANDSYKDRAWYYLALSIFYQKQYRSAIFELNRFLLLCTTPDLCNEARYWIAESYYYLNDYIKAIEEYNRFITQNKNKQLIINSYDRIGEIYFNQKRYDEAIIEWRKALTLTSKKFEDSNRVIKIGEALFLSERYSEALDILEPLIHAVNDATISSKAQLIVGRIYQIQGKHWQAIKYLNEIPESMIKIPAFLSVQYFKALSYIALNDIYNARLNLKSYILISNEDSPYYYNARYELGKILLNTKDLDEGISLLADVQVNSNDIDLRSRASFELGQLYLKNNTIEKAIPYLENAISINDQESQKYVMMTLSELYIATDRYDDAKRLLDFMLEKYPYEENRDEMLYLEAKIYILQGDVEKSLEYFELIKEVNPFSKYLVELDYAHAVDFFKRGDYNSAIASCNRYLNNYKVDNRYEVLIILSRSYIKINNFKKAVETINQLIAKFPKKNGLDEILYELSLSLNEKGVNVEKYWNFIIKNYYSSITAGKIYIEKGDEAYKKKNYQSASYFYSQYLSIKGRPRERSVLLFYIISLYELKQYNTIIKTLKDSEYIAVDDYTTKLLIKWLAKSYYMLKDYTIALNTFMKLPLMDYSMDDLVLISDTALKNNQPDIAIETLQYMEQDNRYNEVAYNIALYYKNNGNIDLATEYFKKVLIKKHHGMVLSNAQIQLAQIYLEQEQFDNALELVKNIQDKENMIMRDSIAFIAHYKLGNINEALSIINNKLNDINMTAFADEIFTLLLQHYYKQNDIKNLKIIYSYSSKRKKLISVSNYYYGLIHYINNNYNQAINYFTIASRFQDEYGISSRYYLGIIYFAIQKNFVTAKRNFDRYFEKAEQDDINYYNAKIYVSMLLFETGKKDESKTILYEIVNNEGNILAKIKATHLIKHYGF